MIAPLFSIMYIPNIIIKIDNTKLNIHIDELKPFILNDKYALVIPLYTIQVPTIILSIAPIASV